MFSNTLSIWTIFMVIGFFPYAAPEVTGNCLADCSMCKYEGITSNPPTKNPIQIWFLGSDMCDDKKNFSLTIDDSSVTAKISNPKNVIGYHGVLMKSDEGFIFEKVTLSKMDKDTFVVSLKMGQFPLDSQPVTVFANFVFLIKEGTEEEKENIKEMELNENLIKTFTTSKSNGGALYHSFASGTNYTYTIHTCGGKGNDSDSQTKPVPQTQYYVSEKYKPMSATQMDKLRGLVKDEVDLSAAKDPVSATEKGVPIRFDCEAPRPSSAASGLSTPFAFTSILISVMKMLNN